MDILKDKNATIIHNPTSNMKLGSGFAKVPALIEKGFNLSLGTDGAASNNNINMFEEMHIASIIHKGKTNDPTLVKPEEVFKMATSNGARMQRRNDTGALAVGKKADIVAINLDKPHLMPATDLLALMMYSVQASDVCMTMIDGQILYENGLYHTIDAEKARFDLQNAMGRLYG
jgi:5-methylthioadenosine/S-adenosylhomocysteine deaminase